MRSLIYISAQPATLYYAWQIEVMINNFLFNGIEAKDIHIVCSINNGSTPTEWLKLQKGYGANFFFYEDTRVDKSYAPSIQAHILEKHWKQNQELETEAIFFHDCDFLFIKPFNFKPFLEDDKWYFSDTISYIGASYILSKGVEVLDVMCKSIGIEKQLVIDNQRNSGGAQKLFKNITSHYWRKVYDHEYKLWYALQTVKDIKKENDPYGIQVWTASMWAELWTGLMMGKQIRAPKEFDFCLGCDTESRLNEVCFFHNAGVVDNKSGFFFKVDYTNLLPYNNCKEPNKNTSSHFYWKWIERTSKATKLLG